MTRLLLEPALCESVLEGLVASLGGLDGSLAQSCGTALSSLLLEGAPLPDSLANFELFLKNKLEPGKMSLCSPFTKG
jgi:Tubulin folding cofactor D C terminal